MEIYVNKKFKDEILMLGSNPIITKVGFIDLDTISDATITLSSIPEVLNGTIKNIPYTEKTTSVYGVKVGDGLLSVQFNIQPEDIDTNNILKFYWSGGVNKKYDTEGAFIIFNNDLNEKIKLSLGENVFQIHFFEDTLGATIKSFETFSDTTFLDQSCVFSGNSVQRQTDTVSPESYFFENFLKGKYDKNTIDRSGRDLVQEEIVREYTGLTLNCDETIIKDDKKYRYGLSQELDENEESSIQFSGTVSYNEWHTRFGHVIEGTRRENITRPIETCSDVILRCSQELAEEEEEQGNFYIGDDFNVVYKNTKDKPEATWIVQASIEGSKLSDKVILTTQREPGKLNLISPKPILLTTEDDFKYDIEPRLPVFISRNHEPIEVVLKYDGNKEVNDGQLEYFYSSALNDIFSIEHTTNENGEIVITFEPVPELSETECHWYPTLPEGVEINEDKDGWLYPVTIKYDNSFVKFCPVIKILPDEENFVEVDNNTGRIVLKTEIDGCTGFGLSQTSGAHLVDEEGNTLNEDYSDWIEFDDARDKEIYVDYKYGRVDLLFCTSDKTINYNYDYNTNWRRSIYTTTCTVTYEPNIDSRKDQIIITSLSGANINGGIGIYKFKVSSPSYYEKLELVANSSINCYFHKYNDKYGEIPEDDRKSLIINEDTFYKKGYDKTGFVVYVVVDKVLKASTLELKFGGKTSGSVSFNPDTEKLSLLNESDIYYFYHEDEEINKKIYLNTETGNISGGYINIYYNMVPSVPSNGNYYVELTDTTEKTFDFGTVKFVKKPEINIENEGLDTKNQEDSVLYISPIQNEEVVYKLNLTSSWTGTTEVSRVSWFDKNLEIRNNKELGTISIINITGNPNISSKIYLEISSKDESEKTVDKEIVAYSLRTFLPEILKLRYKSRLVDSWRTFNVNSNEIIWGVSSGSLKTSSYSYSIPIYLRIDAEDYSGNIPTFDDSSFITYGSIEDIKNYCRISTDIEKDWHIETKDEDGEVQKKECSQYLTNLQFQFETPNDLPGYNIRYSIKENKQEERFDIVGNVKIEVIYPNTELHDISTPLTFTYTLRVSNNYKKS